MKTNIRNPVLHLPVLALSKCINFQFFLNSSCLQELMFSLQYPSSHPRTSKLKGLSFLICGLKIMKYMCIDENEKNIREFFHY